MIMAKELSSVPRYCSVNSKLESDTVSKRYRGIIF